jgi:glycosyltransferase involved in cell wall biosynthesis
VSRRPRAVCSVAYTHYRSDPRVRREAEALADRGDNVTVVALQREGEPSEQQIGNVRVIGLPITRYRGNGARGYLMSYGAFFVRASAYLARHCRQYDVVHVHSIPEAMVFAAVIPDIAGASVVLDVHDLSSEAYASRFGRTPRPVAIAERLSLKYADAVVTVHDRYRQMIIERGVRPDKVTVVHNTPDERLFPMHAPSWPEGEGFRIVYHGALLRRYGLETAVRAVAELRDRIPGLTFEIYGDGDFRADLVLLIDELGLQGTVKLSEGAVPLDEIPQAVAGAHVGVVPFLPERFTETILPTKLLEYVRLGIPVVVARNPVIEGYFDEKAVHFVSPGAVDDLVKAIEAIHGDPHSAIAGAVRAQEFFDRYSWERDRRRLFEIMDEVAKR